MLTYREAAWVGSDRRYLATLGLTGDEIVELGGRLFLLLPQLLLSTTKRFRPDHWESRASMRVGIAKRVQARVVLFLSGDWRALYDTLEDPTAEPAVTPVKPDGAVNEFGMRKRATQLDRGGELSRAQSVLEALPPMDRTPEVFEILQSKFPPACDEERASLRPLLEDLPSSVFDSSKCCLRW